MDLRCRIHLQDCVLKFAWQPMILCMSDPGPFRIRRSQMPVLLSVVIFTGIFGIVLSFEPVTHHRARIVHSPSASAADGRQINPWGKFIAACCAYRRGAPSGHASYVFPLGAGVVPLNWRCMCSMCGVVLRTTRT